jgi:hypothetical protein
VYGSQLQRPDDELAGGADPFDIGALTRAEPDELRRRH